ncbi:hypothetical protein A2U01_0065898, partial [Trifolium medium]|nr:hypothetical protein [Trifolium medium]
MKKEYVAKLLAKRHNLADMKASREKETKKLGEEATVQGEAITSLTQERDDVVATSGELAEEKAALEEEIEG